MLTQDDIKKIIEVVATKEDVKELKEEIIILRDSVRSLTNSIDKLAKSVEDLRQEYIAITAKVDIHEKWIKQVAKKVGIKLEY